MIKSDLIDVLAREKNLPFNVSEKIINVIFDSLAEALVSGKRVEIRGFGSFTVRDYDSYIGRNPKTGDSVEVKPKKSPFFKVGKELKIRIAKS